MKKLFKNNKQKPTVTPTPLALPPETPIHAQRSRTALPPQSYEAVLKPDEKWIFLDEERQVTPSKPQKVPRPPSISSLPGAWQSQPLPLLLPVPTPPPSAPSPQLQTQPQPQPKKKSPPVFPWPDHRITQHVETNIDSLNAPSIHSTDTKEQREKESTLDALGNFLFRQREGTRPSSERDHDKDRPRETQKPVEPQWDITQVIGQLIATASEDWTIVLELCERASANESVAKEATRALRREFKYGDPPAQLSAARLWAIMLRNCSEVFTEQTASPKTLHAVEDVITSSRTSPVVRERLLEVLGTAAYHCTKNDRKHPFAVLWRKVKPQSAPEQGLPIDPSDPIYNPSVHNTAQQTLPPTQGQHLPALPDSTPARAAARPASDLPPELSESTQPPSKKTRHRSQIIPIEEEMEQIFNDCEDAHNNARMLNDFLAFASPADIEADADGVVSEFYMKCIASQERFASQIPWATSIAEKSRDELENLTVPSAPSTNQAPQPPVATKEEEMLAALLAANQALFESIRVHDELQRLAAAERVERAVEERSRVDTKLDRSHMYVAADGSLYAPENDTAGGGSSRSASPNPLLSTVTETTPSSFYSPVPRSSPQSHLLQADFGYPQNQHQNQATVHNNPNGPWTNTPNQQYQLSQNNPYNLNLTAPSRHPLHGPRALISHSRTPSPDLSLNQPYGIGLGLHGTTTTSIAPGLPASLRPRSSEFQSEPVRDRLERLNFSSPSQHGRISPSQRLVPRAESDPVRTHARDPAYDDKLGDEEYEEEARVPSMPLVPSAKALGKRRAIEKAVDLADAFDPDDLFKEPRAPTPLSSYLSSSDDEDDMKPKPKPTVYVYDAAAEREKERQTLLARTKRAERGGTAIPNGIHD